MKTKLYHVADEYFQILEDNNLNINNEVVWNKEEARPYFYIIKAEKDILWLAPITSRYKEHLSNSSKYPDFYQQTLLEGRKGFMRLEKAIPVPKQYMRKDIELEIDVDLHQIQNKFNRILISKRNQQKKTGKVIGLNSLAILDYFTNAKAISKQIINTRSNKYIKEGEVEVLVVYKLDRLTRNLADLIAFLNDCAIKQVKFISIVENLDLNSAIGRLFVYIIGILAQFEREQVSERTFTGLIEKARKGEYPFRNVPYGFTKDENHKLHAKPDEVKVIRHIYKLYALDYEAESITVEYADSVGLKFHKGIFAFLSRYIYQGYVEVPKKSGKLIPICEPIFSEEEIKNINDRKYHNKRRGVKRHNYKYFNKVKINNQSARHTKVKRKDNLVYYYYYIKNVAYINESEIDQFLYNFHKMREFQKVTALENEITEYSKALICGEISKAEFDSKYEELKQLHVDEVKFKYINVIIEDNIRHFELIEK